MLRKCMLFRRIAPVLAAALAALLAVPLAAAAADGAKGKKVLLVESFSTHPYVATIMKSFRERAEAAGMQVTIQAAGLDAALQARQVEDGIARKFDVIAVQPVSEVAIVPVLTRAKQAGIPVFIINNTPKSGTEDLYVAFVGQDQVEMGRIVGRSVIKALADAGRPNGKIALITGALQEGLGPRRVAGFKEALGQSQVQIAAIEDGRWDTATSERIAGQLYARFAATGGLDALYGMADNQAVAALKAAEAAGIAVGQGPKQMLVFGGNCLKEGIEAIKSGKMVSTVSQIPTELGQRAAETIAAYLDGKVPPKEVLLPVELINKGNVASWEAACTY